jgi:hypothetical protein
MEDIMHDIDRTQLESMEAFEAFEAFETQELHEVFNEGEQMELAAELLEVRDEQELNHFLGNLIKRASGLLGRGMSSPLGQSLGGILKGAAKDAARQAVPVVSDAVGSRIGGRLGSSVAKGLTAFGTSALNLEYEALSHEDREFEGAQQFVRLASETVRNAVAAAPGADPRAVAQSALARAAQAVVPGMLPAAGGAGAAQAAGLRGQSGRWLRRGSKIVLFNV